MRPPHKSLLGVGALLACGLSVRVAFLLWGAERYYGAGMERFVNDDSASYTQSVINLLTMGWYTFDPSVPDASFGRLPAYPLFWGLHALLVGAHRAHAAVAVTQTMLDTLGIYLIWAALRRTDLPSWAPWIAGLVLAVYPFSLVWITMSGTEAFGVFLVLSFVFLLTRSRLPHGPLLIGALAGVAFLTRAYLLTLLPAALLYWVAQGTSWPELRRRAVLLFVAFGVVYLPWPIRNAVNHQRLVLVHPLTAGYVTFSPDFAAFRSWVYAWNPGLEPYHQQVIRRETPMGFPPHVFSGPEEAREADRLVERAMECGTGFRSWGFLPVEGPDCDAEVAAGFDELRRSYASRHPIRTWIVVPALNLRKAAFKLDLERVWEGPSLSGYLTRAMFLWRSLWVLLGLAGIVAFWRRPVVLAVAMVSLPTYLAITGVFRQVEMRYLIQADVLLLLPAALLADHLLRGALRRVRGPAPGATSPG